jgi:DNA recombination protein RmuC
MEFMLPAFILGFGICWFFFSKNKKFSKLNEENISLGKENASLAGKYESLELEKNNLRKKLEEMEVEAKRLLEENSRIKTEKESFQVRTQEQKKDIEGLRIGLESHFKNLANDIFEEKTKSFKEISNEQITNILSPFNKELKDFKEKIEKTYDGEKTERISLKLEIEKFVKVNESLSKDANNLTTALKGDVKTQGRWGEFILEKILEGSGLRKGIEFIPQGEGIGLKGPTGNDLRPDSVINLPEEKHLVLDSKVSLVHYERYLSETDPEEKKRNLKLLDQSIQEHVKGLSDKKYNFNEKLISPDFTLMFMPIEAAFSLAVEYNKDIFMNAWQKNIVIVGPTTLMATLRTVASIWRIEKQNRNHLEIARLGGTLYDRLVSFFEDVTKINSSFVGLEKSFDAVVKKLATGRGNMISIAEKMKELGAKSSKQFPSHILDDKDIL